jgi:hypothetical protein
VQGLFATPVGFVVSCSDGAAWSLASKDGRPNRIAASGARRLVLPASDGAVVLGGGPGGSRRVVRAGPQPLGDCAPEPGTPFLAAPHLSVWVEQEGVRMLRGAAKDPEPIPALGTRLRAFAETGGVLYAAGEDGTLTAVSLDAPDRVLWAAPLGGKPGGDLLTVGDAMVCVVDGAVVAVDR